MSNYNTGNPVPSIDPRDLDDNATVFDLLLQSPAASVSDRLGVQRKTWAQMEDDAAALVSPNVAALAAVTPAIDKGVFFSATVPVTMGAYTLNSFNRSLGATADQPAFRAAIGAMALSDTGAYAGSAASLTTSRSISATGDATWTVNFNGTANAAATLTLANTGITAGTYESVTVDAKGRATAGTSVEAFANFTLQNSWTVTVGSRAAYRKVSGSVQIEMQIVGGSDANGTIVATLPGGYRPPFPLIVPVCSGTNAAISSTVTVPRVLIGTDGTIKCNNCSTTTGISFFATIALT